jgi:molybdenum cofactor cytidylyltransferase
MICAIVLAAGLSRRMGMQKLLLPLGDKPVIAHVVDTLLRSEVAAKVFVVVGNAEVRIREALINRDIHFVTPGQTKDMLASVRAGIRALPKSCDAILVALGDQPGLRVRLLKRMAAALKNIPRSIIVPSYRGQCGHPLLFSVRYRKELLTRYDNTGLRGLRYAHPDKVFIVKTVASSVLEDMDTPADYRRHLKRFA